MPFELLPQDEPGNPLPDLPPGFHRCADAADPEEEGSHLQLAGRAAERRYDAGEAPTAEWRCDPEGPGPEC